MKKALFSLFLFFIAPSSFADPGAAEVRAGNAHYRQGKFQEALAQYEKAAQKAPLDPRIAYDLGVAAYGTGDHAGAISHFQKALLSDDEDMKRNAHFNMGDAFYRQGMALKDKNIDQAIKELETSLVSFEKARAIDMNDVQAAENYEFVKEQIERLKRQQQQQQQQKQQDKQQQQQDKQQEEGPQQEPPPEGEQDKDEEGKDQQDQKKDDKASSQEQQKREEQGKSEDEKQGDQKSDQDKKDAPSGQKDGGQISSQEDANTKLDDFERNELPKGLLNFITRSKEMRAVEKDW